MPVAVCGRCARRHRTAAPQPNTDAQGERPLLCPVVAALSLSFRDSGNAYPQLRLPIPVRERRGLLGARDDHFGADWEPVE